MHALVRYPISVRNRPCLHLHYISVTAVTPPLFCRVPRLRWFMGLAHAFTVVERWQKASTYLNNLVCAHQNADTNKNQEATHLDCRGLGGLPLRVIAAAAPVCGIPKLWETTHTRKCVAQGSVGRTDLQKYARSSACTVPWPGLAVACYEGQSNCGTSNCGEVFTKVVSSTQ